VWRSESCAASIRVLFSSVRRHAVEGLNQAAQLIGRLAVHAIVQLPARPRPLLASAWIGTVIRFARYIANQRTQTR